MPGGFQEVGASGANHVKTKAADYNKTDISKQPALVEGKRAAKTVHSMAQLVSASMRDNTTKKRQLAIKAEIPSAVKRHLFPNQTPARTIKPSQWSYGLWSYSCFLFRGRQTVNQAFGRLLLNPNFFLSPTLIQIIFKSNCSNFTSTAQPKLSLPKQAAQALKQLSLIRVDKCFVYM